MRRLLGYLLAMLFGGVGPRARKEVRAWTKGNPALRTLSYGWIRREIIAATAYPIGFSCSIAAAWLLIACAVCKQPWFEQPRLESPAPMAPHDFAAFAGTPWSITATVIALVYPIVLAFISMLLGRRTTWSVSMRVYMFDTGFLPAGASSILALIVVGVEYFATPYVTDEFLNSWFAFLLVFHAGWTLTNLILTAVFLLRTMYFIQAEEQQLAFARVAVDIAHRRELLGSAKQHIYVSVPKTDWGYSDFLSGDGDDGRPQVGMFERSGSRPEVVRDLRGSYVLAEVYTRPLHWVVKRWCKRAQVRVDSEQPTQSGRRRNTSRFDRSRNVPSLAFPAALSGTASGEVTLCSVRNGPALTWLERRVVRLAHRYRASTESFLKLSTKAMLEELGEEAIAAAELQRYSAASDALSVTYKLHRTLLLASSVDTEGELQNVAAIGASPYGFGGESFNRQWLTPYIDIGRIAVDRLEVDARLFRTLTYASPTIARGLPATPVSLLVDAQLPASWLMRQLESWWTRKIEEHHVGGIPTLPSLPLQLMRTYEEAVVQFINGWKSFRVDEPVSIVESERWRSYCARTGIYASHIENCAQYFLDAVHREDSIAASWLLDNFLKWWSDRKFELETGHLDGDWRVRHVTIGLSELGWADAQSYLWDGHEAITIELAEHALNLAVQRYWESMRLYLALLLIERAHESTGDLQSWHLDMVAALVLGQSLHEGGTVTAEPMNSMGSAMAAMLWTNFAHPLPARRLDGLSESWRRFGNRAVVSGRSFTPDKGASPFHLLLAAKSTLLTALAAGRRTNAVDARRLVEGWWRDVERLRDIERYLHSIRKASLNAPQRNRRGVLVALQKRLNQGMSIRRAQLSVVHMVKDVAKVARREEVTTLASLSVSPDKVRRFGRAASLAAFDPTSLPAPLKAVRFERNVVNAVVRSHVTHEWRMEFLERTESQPNEGYAEDLGKEFGRSAAALAVARWLSAHGVRPINGPELRFKYDAPDLAKQQFLVDVAAACSAFSANGEQPVILAGRGTASALLNRWRWGNYDSQTPLPEGITLQEYGSDDGRRSTLNGWTIYDFETKDGDCYVVPASVMSTLYVEAGRPEDAVSVSWQLEGNDGIDVTLRCLVRVGEEND